LWTRPASGVAPGGHTVQGNRNQTAGESSMNSTRAQALAALAAALQFAAMTAVTEPIAEADRGPVDLRRTTLPVRDMERSLALYRDALGLRVVRDSHSVRPPVPGVVVGSPPTLPNPRGPATSR
jgi:Glyoxalase/Bleomycin resistance protein/Dioxygenase superfamily